MLILLNQFQAYQWAMRMLDKLEESGDGDHSVARTLITEDCFDLDRFDYDERNGEVALDDRDKELLRHFSPFASLFTQEDVERVIGLALAKEIEESNRRKEWYRRICAELPDNSEFTYQGYHFIPVGKSLLDFFKLSRRLRSDNSLGLNTYIWQKRPYSYDEFYHCAASAGGGDADIFACQETGLSYIPGLNELFIFNEDGQPEEE